MKRKKTILATTVVVLGFGIAAYFTFFHHPDGWPSSWPVLRAAATATDKVEIKVGPNIMVSRSLEANGHSECTIAADPKDPRRLFASAMFLRKGNDHSIAGYYSHDGGATWQKSLDLDPSSPVERLMDETLAYGPSGELYLVHMRIRGLTAALPLGQTGPGHLEFHRSLDGGKSWEKRGIIDRTIDRPWIAADRTAGVNRGRLYWCGIVQQPIFGSTDDGGATFAREVTPAHDVHYHRPSMPVVMSDGSVVYVMRYPPGRGRVTQLRVIRSDDGATVREVGRVPTRWRHARLEPSELTNEYDCFPQLAVGPPGSLCADRLFCVWIDGKNTDEMRLLFSRSDDRGTTWTPAVVISEQSMEDNANDFVVARPALAVNPAGVVAVSWYDARGFPKAALHPQFKTAGYNVRLRVSLDGGETWAPSVQVNEAPAKSDVGEFLHTAGLAATADGRFFPAWIDDRTGKPQLWVAACMVHKPE